MNEMSNDFEKICWPECQQKVHFYVGCACENVNVERGTRANVGLISLRAVGASSGRTRAIPYTLSAISTDVQRHPQPNRHPFS